MVEKMTEKEMRNACFFCKKQLEVHREYIGHSDFWEYRICDCEDAELYRQYCGYGPMSDLAMWSSVDEVREFSRRKRRMKRNEKRERWVLKDGKIVVEQV